MIQGDNFRGTSTSTKLAPFRECSGRLHEIRSLAPNVNMIATTATATHGTKQAIIDILCMDNPSDISESPDKPNIVYIVDYIKKDSTLQQTFAWLGEEAKMNGIATERTIIYCQTVK